jgi:type II secretory pathway predicted ATPase ExeA
MVSRSRVTSAHLNLAGRADQPFSDDAAALIHQASRRLPRAVNNVALHSLSGSSVEAGPSKGAS